MRRENPLLCAQGSSTRRLLPHEMVLREQSRGGAAWAPVPAPAPTLAPAIRLKSKAGQPVTKQPGRQLGCPAEGLEFSVQVTEGCGSA